MDYTVHGILQTRILEWVAFPFSGEIFQTQGSNPGLLHCRWILYQLNYQGSLIQRYASLKILINVHTTSICEFRLHIPRPVLDISLRIFLLATFVNL